MAVLLQRQAMTRVLIIDDHPIVLQGCRRVLEDAGVETVLEARDAVCGYRTYLRQRPDVVLIDLGLRSGDLAGLNLIRRIHAHDQQARILVLTMHSDPIIVSRALEAGAMGYVLKDTSSEELVKAFEKVRRGQAWIGSDLAIEVALLGKDAHRGRLADLTPREIQTLQLLSQGKAYNLIAKELDISYKTVVNICYQLRQKLGVRTLPELIRLAIELRGATS
jgi:two-component system, NarL family, invasion response regulator UvrY